MKDFRLEVFKKASLCRNFEDEVFRLFRKVKPEYITSDIEPNYDIACNSCYNRLFNEFTKTFNPFKLFNSNQEMIKAASSSAPKGKPIPLNALSKVI